MKQREFGELLIKIGERLKAGHPYGMADAAWDYIELIGGSANALEVRFYVAERYGDSAACRDIASMLGEETRGLSFYDIVMRDNARIDAESPSSEQCAAASNITEEAPNIEWPHPDGFAGGLMGND